MSSLLKRVGPWVAAAVALALGAGFSVASARAASDSHNPFASAESLLAERGAASSAGLRLVYTETREDSKGEPSKSEVVIDLADDWALVTRGSTTLLYDYRLSRTISLDSQRTTFVALNPIAELMFRVRERQNRAAMEKASQAAGTEVIQDACDADANLGVMVPGLEPHGTPELLLFVDGTLHGAVIRCDGRMMAATAFTALPAPATLWPVLSAQFPQHPGMLKAISILNWVPRHLESRYSLMKRDFKVTWDIVSAQQVATAYPLPASARNTTADWLAKRTSAALVELGVKAVAGTANGGPPSWQAWNARLTALLERDRAAAAMTLPPTLTMFPESMRNCPASGETACDILKNARTYAQADPAASALFALLELAPGNPDAPATAVRLMAQAQASPLAKDPALAAGYANVLRRHGGAMKQQAEAAGLPLDRMALVKGAVEGYPYNPSYWMDVANALVDSWDFEAGLAIVDIAMSLPMPEAQRSNANLLAFKASMKALRTDFPYYFAGE